ncbi:MFS general substrate transporter [Auriculariales sp. MPI-PUGE-AT-0066]|nr:MFS general substrate transporter [Auriculariales sp. MPI-PUGE-AT-0066]
MSTMTSSVMPAIASPTHPVPSTSAATLSTEQLPAPPIQIQSRPGSSGQQLGTKEDPIVIDWADGDTENPLNWSALTKLTQTVQVALGTFCVTLGSSTYAGGARAIGHALGMNNVVTLLGVSLYVLGFGVGPLVWAPCSELYGRKRIFLVSWIPFTLAQIGCWFAVDGTMMLVFRFLAGAFGTAPLAGGGGTVGDMFAPQDRTYAMALYSMMPFLGPIMGPLIGGAIVDTVGWKRIFLILFCFALFLATLAVLNMRETYAPVLLRRKAQRMHRESGGKKHYVSKYDLGKNLSLGHVLRLNLSRPFVFLFTEPIVTLLAIYVAIEYAILYALFAAFPIVFIQHRGWNRVKGGSAYLGVGAGVLIAVALVPLQARWYKKVASRSPGGKAPPETRLFSVIFGAFAAPIGLFWFAWTSQPSRPAIVSIIAVRLITSGIRYRPTKSRLKGAPFGFGIFQLFNGLTAYIVDTYGIYCASAIASTVVLRCMLAAAFPMFTPALFEALGDQAAMSIFAGLCTLCVPIPILFYKYGPSIRARSKHAQMLAVVAAPTTKKTDEEAGSRPTDEKMPR